jgi:hypothetical protein
MKKYTVDYIVELHIKSDNIIELNMASNDSKKHNREMKKLAKLFVIMEENRELAERVLATLLNYDCITTKINSATECLKLGIYIQKAENILEEIASMENIGLNRLNAEMTLRVWQGEMPGKTL